MGDSAEADADAAPKNETNETVGTDVGTSTSTGTGTGTDDPAKDEVDEFLASSGVDDRAAADFRECHGDVQRKVLNRGDIKNSRNPSATLLLRIRDARAEVNSRNASGGGAGMGLPSSKAVDEFIKANGVDRHTARTLRSCSPTVKRAVLAAGELGPGDPAALLMARIHEVKGGAGGTPQPPSVHAMGAGGYGPPGMPPPGYGYPPHAYWPPPAWGPPPGYYAGYGYPPPPGHGYGYPPPSAAPPGHPSNGQSPSYSYSYGGSYSPSPSRSRSRNRGRSRGRGRRQKQEQRRGHRGGGGRRARSRRR